MNTRSFSLLLAPFAAALLLTSCASTDQVVYDKTARPPTTHVEVFKNGQSAERQFKIIAELSYLGPREDELKAERFFMKRGMALGGDAILFSIQPGGEKGGNIAFSTSWVFFAKVIAFQNSGNNR